MDSSSPAFVLCSRTVFVFLFNQTTNESLRFGQDGLTIIRERCKYIRGAAAAAIATKRVMTKKTLVDIEGTRVELSNLEKVFYPQVGFTKAQVIDYYARLAPVLLPHLARRPISLKRYPDGVTGGYFFQKQARPIGLTGSKPCQFRPGGAR